MFFINFNATKPLSRLGQIAKAKSMIIGNDSMALTDNELEKRRVANPGCTQLAKHDYGKLNAMKWIAHVASRVGAAGIFGLNLRATFGRAFAGFACAGAMLALSGCAGTIPPFGEVDGMGRGAVISQERVDSLGRPPKQIVYRYDDHRYIENDPSGGYIGGCEGEMYYVDENLGIRTEFGLNQETAYSRVPEGVLKIDDKAPFVVARDQTRTYISFDQGRSFERIMSAQDLAVVGDIFFLGSGSTTGIQYSFRSSEIEKARYSKSLTKNNNGRLEVFEKSKGYFEDRSNWERMRVEIGEIDDRHFFKCVHDLPWRPSVKEERSRLRSKTTQ